MKFATLWSLKESVDLNSLAEAIGRRADYEYPDGVTVEAEFWTSKASPAVIAVLEADDAASLLINTAAWVDKFDVDIFPVSTFEEGMAGLSKHLTTE